MGGDPISMAVGGALLGAVLSSKPPNPGAPPVVKPPQALKQPDQAAVRNRNNMTTALPGGVVDSPAGTLLTGPGGVSKKDTKLGTSTALGA